MKRRDHNHPHYSFVQWPVLDFIGLGRKVPSEVSCLPTEKYVSYLLPNLLEIISLTPRDHGVRVNCPAKMGKMGDMY